MIHANNNHGRRTDMYSNVFMKNIFRSDMYKVRQPSHKLVYNPIYQSYIPHKHP